MEKTFKPAHRIEKFGSYYFSSLGERIKQLKSTNIDVIRLDIGSPDLPPTQEIIDALCQSANNSSHHGYTMHSGTYEFRKEISDYYKKRFNIDLDPHTEVLSLIGSKEGLFHLCQAFLNPGDVVLVPDPGYPVYSAATKIAGAIPVPFSLTEKNDFLPNFSDIPASVAKQAKMIWLNYPNNPTGAVADLNDLKQMVDFAKENQILIAFDAPYTDVCFDGFEAPSILQLAGARDIVIEFNSLSKTYNMAGWRLGFACGNAEVIGFLSTYKSQLDSANFRPALDAGQKALSSDQKWLKSRNQIYAERRDIIVKALTECGMNPPTPLSTLYIWCKIPKSFTSSKEFCDACLNEIGVSFAPGFIYGENGKSYIRISLGANTERIKEAMSRLKQWLSNSVL